MIDKALFSSVKNNSNAKDNWQTPKFLFNYLNNIYNYEWDLAASNENHLCDKYYTEEINSLIQPWEGRCFCNPPYSMLKEFAEKAIEELNRPRKEELFITFLIPARTDTQAFHKLFDVCNKLIFIKGRLKYENKNSKPINSAPFPSCIIHLSSLKIERIVSTMIIYNNICQEIY